MQTKRCVRCGEEKALADFHRDGLQKDGHRSTCRACALAAARSWDALHPDQAARRKKAYVVRNPAPPRPPRPPRPPKPPKPPPRPLTEAELRERKERKREQQRAADRRWRAKNRDAQREYRQRNRERERERQRRWYEANKERAFDKARARTALRRGAVAGEVVKRAAVFDRDAGVCGICGELVDPNKWDLDHIIPLSLDGEHSYSNVQVAHPWCNRSKGATLVG